MQGQEAADGVASLRTELRLLRKDFTDVASSQRNLVDLGNELGYHIAGLRRDVRRGLADVAAVIRGKEEEEAKGRVGRARLGVEWGLGRVR